MKDQMHEKVYKQGKRCCSENEKRERYLASHLRYGTKPWSCDCGVTILLGNKTKHLKTRKHLRSLSP